MVQEAKEFEEEDKKTEARIGAKNAFDSYIYSIKNQVDDPEKLSGKLSDEEKTTINDAVKEAREWLDANAEAEQEEYEEQKKKLEDICNPIITKVMGAAGGPGGAGGEAEENPEDL